MNNYDEDIDIMIKNVLQEKARNYEVPDEVKERIDQRVFGSDLLNFATNFRTSRHENCR